MCAPMETQQLSHANSYVFKSFSDGFFSALIVIIFYTKHRFIAVYVCKNGEIYILQLKTICIEEGTKINPRYNF